METGEHIIDGKCWKMHSAKSEYGKQIKIKTSIKKPIFYL